MPATLTLEAVSLPQVGDKLILTDNYRGREMSETFNTDRFSNYRVKIGDDIESTINNLAKSLDADYNGFDDFEIEVIKVDALTITHPNSGYFDNFTNESNGSFTSSVNNEADGPYYTFQASPTPAQNNDTCSHIGYDITFTDEVGIEYLAPITAPVVSNPDYIEFPRNLITGNYFAIRVTFDTPDGEITRIIIKSKIYEVIINDVNVNYTPDGATVEIETGEISSVSSQVLEYSLDGFNYSQNNVFTGLVADSYTAYVRDNFGCVKSQQFEVEDNQEFFTTPPKYFYVSLLNSIRFAKRELGFQNVDNELTCEERNDPLNGFSHIVLDGDNIKVQFKSSYPYNNAKVHSQLNTYDVAPIKLSDNLGKIDVRDAVTLSLDGKLAVYFDGGNTYDNETGQPNGLNTLNGNVLIAHEEGTFIDVEGFGFVQITDIRQYDEYNNNFIIKTNLNYTQAQDTAIVRTYYNAEDYEVYEFIVPFNDADGFYFVTLHAGSSDTGALEMYRSEDILFSTEYITGIHTIEYLNTKNNDINFGTGYLGLKRVPYEVLPKYSPKDDADTYRTDTSVRLIESNVDEIYDFEFVPMPLSIARSLELALSQDRVKIDGLAYVKEGTPTIERIGVSNLYTFIAKMTRAESFNTNSGIGIVDTSVTGYVGTGTGSGYLRID